MYSFQETNAITSLSRLFSYNNIIGIVFPYFLV